MFHYILVLPEIELCDCEHCASISFPEEGPHVVLETQLLVHARPYSPYPNRETRLIAGYDDAPITPRNVFRLTAWSPMTLALSVMRTSVEGCWWIFGSRLQ